MKSLYSIHSCHSHRITLINRIIDVQSQSRSFLSHVADFIKPDMIPP
jgi:hypothetical protein